MEENNEEKKEATILKQEDISQIIKHFSFIIQQRFQQIQKNYNYFACLNSIIYDRSEIEKIILRKYNDYKTSDQHEIKLLQKFVERLLQIFQFFRQKTDQPHILQQMSQKISQKLNQIIQNDDKDNFFVNMRPKTHTLNIKPFQNHSQSNDFLSIIGPESHQRCVKFDFIDNITTTTKLNTLTQPKRIIQVGKLFKYVFSILKRGYLVRLRMQKPQKKYRVFNKENINKGDQSSIAISVEGTCALLRNTKGNKETIQNQVGKVLSLCRDKQPPVDPLTVVNQNKAVFQISQKIKNRSISTNQYSFLSSLNHSTLKQSTSKIRQLQRKINLIYDVLNIQKSTVVRVAKQPQGSKKDQIKRNYFIQNQSKKYLVEYRKWRQNDKRDFKWQYKKKKTEQPLNQDQHQPISLKLPTQCNQIKELFVDIQQGEQQQHIQQQSQQIIIHQQQVTDQNHHALLLHTQNPTPDIVSCADQKQTETKTQPTMMNDYRQNSSTQNPQPTTQQTVAHYCQSSSSLSSKPYSKFTNNLKSDKLANIDNVLNDHSLNNIINSKPNPNPDSSLKCKSVSNPQKRILKLDLPTMYADNFNWTNQSNIFFQNNVKKNTKLSEKSQYYFQNYHHDSDDDGVFVPLLPRKHQNNQNFIQTKNGMPTSTKKTLIPNCHPLNRCRLFREKKLVRNSIMVPLMDFSEDLKLKKGKIKQTIN